MTTKIIDTDTIEKMNLTKFDKAVKWIRIGIEAAFIAVFVILCVAVGAKNHKIKQYREALKYQCEISDSLNQTVKDLWSMPAISVDVACNIQQKGLVNLQQTTQIARSVSEMTRGEVLMAMDSLQRVNNQK